MSEYSLRGGFSLTWTIENFALSGYQKGERLKTGFFYAYSQEVCLMLYPRGKDDSNYIAVEPYGDGIHLRHFDFLYSILDSENTPLIWKEVKNFNKPHVHINLLTRNEVFGRRRSTFLPNNTLTVLCQIFKPEESFSIPLLRFARTCIQKNQCFLRWEILNLCSLRPHVKMAKDFPAMTEYESYLNMKLFLNNNEKVVFNITYTKGRSLERAFATCKVVILDASGKKFMFAESEHFFESNNRLWQFTSYITKSMLMCDKSLFLPNNTLTLMFECTLSSGVEYSHIEALQGTSKNGATRLTANLSNTSPKTDAKYECGQPSTFSQDLQGLYEMGILSDFNLQSEGKTFPVHKQILTARSPVFKAMFTVDMKEKESEGIEIEDTDAATLLRMIRYIYTDEVQMNMQWKETSKLYAIADRYEILSLKNRCAALIKSSISTLNVCEILVIADLHQDMDLKSTTLHFILQHNTEVIDTEQWQAFEKENAQLATETFRKLCLKKINKE